MVATSHDGLTSAVFPQFFGHPTGRLINERQPFQIDLDEVAKYCSKYKTAMEINA